MTATRREPLRADAHTWRPTIANHGPALLCTQCGFLRLPDMTDRRIPKRCAQ